MKAFRKSGRNRRQLAQFSPATQGGDRYVILPRRLEISAGTLIEGFENAGDWSVIAGNAPSNDAADKIEGSQSLRLDTATGSPHTIEKTVSLNPSTWGDCLEIWYRIDIAGSDSLSDYFDIFLSANAGLTKYFKFSVTPKYCDSWNQYRILKSELQTSGGMTWADPIVKIRIQQFNTGGRNPVVHFDSFRHSVASLPAAVFTWDDCHNSIYSLGLPVFERHKARATVCHVGDYIGTGSYFTAGQIQAIKARGWNNINHSDTHPHWLSYTQAQIETQLNDCAAALAAAGDGSLALQYCAYPYGEYDAEVEAAMATLGFDIGWKIYSPYPGDKSSLFTFHWADVQGWYELPRDLLSSTTTLAQAKTMIDKAARYGMIVCPYGHELIASGTPAGSQWRSSDLDELLAYCAQKNVSVITADDLNNLKSGEIKIKETR